MFDRQLARLKSMLQDAQQKSTTAVDSVSLISTHVSRPKTHKPSLQRPPKYDKPITRIKEQLSKTDELLLDSLFRAKCQDLAIEYNTNHWETFITAFTHKNKDNRQTTERNTLNFSEFSLGPNCVAVINQFIQQTPQLTSLNLSKSEIDPNKLLRLQNLKEIVLNNCKLGNDALQTLFDRLHDSVIERISLSSPQLKHRNTLTRYDRLISLIKTSPSLRTLQLRNIQIQPENGLLQNCRNTALKVIDLSENTNVRGISPTLHSLNLARNNIALPFNLPLTTCELQYLNLAQNKIPYYHFKQFLRTLYFPKLQELILDRISLHGQIKAIQAFLEAAVNLTHLSAVDCDFTPESYTNILNGIKNNRSLKFVDLTRNRVTTERVAQHFSQMLQNTSACHLKLRNCDLKDHLGRILFLNLRRNKTLASIDLMNNLLGDLTARALCNELKHSKTLTALVLQQNIIKYKDMQEIRSYLEGNRYANHHALDSQYLKLTQLDRQTVEASRVMWSEGERIGELQQETEKLEQTYYELAKKEVDNKREELKKEINHIKLVEGQLERDITYAQMRATSMINSVYSQNQMSASLNPQPSVSS